MSENTKIEWCDSTFNPWIGCTKVSPACDHCYAERSTPARAMAVHWGPHAERHRTAPANWAKPQKWNATPFHRCACGWRGATAKPWKEIGICCPVCEGRLYPARQRVFCASLADVFDNQVPAEWRSDLFRLIAATPHLDWLLLTKRIGNVERMLRKELVHGADEYLPLLDMMPLPNLWLGATISNQEEADRDIERLLAVPARVHFISYEPALGGLWIPNALRRSCTRHPMSIDPTDGLCEVCEGRGIWGLDEELAEHEKAPIRKGLDWVICGGESGPGARPMHPEWASSLRDQCAAAGVPFLFKQWGEWLPICEQDEEFTGRLYRSNRKAALHEDQGAIDELYGRTCTVPYEVIHRDGSRHHALEPNAFIAGAMATFKVGKKAAGRLLDGVTHDGFPVGGLAA